MASPATTPQYFVTFRPSIVGVVVTSIPLSLDGSCTAHNSIMGQPAGG
jgi:hypothetical protein